MPSPSPKLILLGFRFAGWLFPPPPLDEKAVPSPEVLEEKAKRLNRFSGILCVPLIVICAVAFSFIACMAAETHLAALDEPLFLIRAEPFELCVWAFFLAVVVAPALSFLILHLV